VTVALDRAGVTGPDGASHHGMWDGSILQVVPGLKIAAPRDATRIAELLNEAVAVSDGPTVLRYPGKGMVGAEVETIGKMGGMDVLARPADGAAQDVLLIGAGMMAGVAAGTAERLADQGIGVTVIDPRWVKPLDEALVGAASEHGLVATVLATLSTGGTVLLPRFRPSAFWDDAARYGATWYTAVPTIHARLLTRAQQLPAPPRHLLRFVRSCSAPLPTMLWQRYEEAIGVPLAEAYGMTEAAHQMASNPLPPGERRPGTVGRATGIEIVALDESWQPVQPGDEGEVAVRGPSVVDEYLDNPAATAAAFRDGWFRTGDVGKLSADGYLSLVGRVKELINRAGEKISPYEVEDVLLAHPAVAEAAAYPVPDEKYGEQVGVVIVLRAEATSRELTAYCAERLAAFKRPARVTILPEIPKGPTGKIQRRNLAALVGE